MTAYVIDATVAVKWVVPEIDHERARSLHLDELAAPELMIAECANVIWKKRKRAELSDEEVAMALTTLERADVQFFPMSGDFRQAAEAAVALDHPAYDCFYLVLAERLGRELITADKRLLAAVANDRTGRFRGRLVPLERIPPFGAV